MNILIIRNTPWNIEKWTDIRFKDSITVLYYSFDYSDSIYIMLDGMYVTKSVSTGLYPNLDLWTTNKLQLQLQLLTFGKLSEPHTCVWHWKWILMFVNIWLVLIIANIKNLVHFKAYYLGTFH